MPKILTRFVAFLLVPCLLVDPSLAAAFENVHSRQQEAVFSSQALAPAVLLARRIKDVSLFPIRRTLGRLVRNPYLRYRISQYKRARETALAGLERNDLTKIARSRNRMGLAVRRLRAIVDGAPGLDAMGGEVHDVGFAHEFLTKPLRQDPRLAIREIMEALKHSVLPDSEALLAYVRSATKTQNPFRRIAWKRPVAIAALVVAAVGFFWLLIPRAPHWWHAIEDAFRTDSAISATYNPYGFNNSSDYDAAVEPSAASPSDPSSLSPEAIDKELKDLEGQEKEIRRHVAVLEKKAAEAQKNIDQAKALLTKEQSEAKVEKKAATQKAQMAQQQQQEKTFENHTKQFEKGEPEAVPQSQQPNSSQSSKSQPFAAVDGIGINTPGERLVVARYLRPVSGFIQTAIAYTFNPETGQWIQPEPTSGNTIPYEKRGPVINSLSQKVTGAWTSLLVPGGEAPISSSVRLNKSHIKFALVRDRTLGFFRLWINRKAISRGLEVSLDLTPILEASPSETAAPPAESRVLLEDSSHWTRQTRAALEEARKQTTPETRAASLNHYVQSSMVYLMSDPMNAQQKAADPGHPIAAIDRFKVKTEYGMMSIGVCNEGNALLDALERQSGDPARHVVGYMLENPSTEVTNWQLHSQTGIWSNGHWFLVDGTPTRNSSLGVQSRYHEPPPAEIKIQRSAATERRVRKTEEKYRQATDQAEQLKHAQQNDHNRLEALALRRTALEQVRVKAQTNLASIIKTYNALITTPIPLSADASHEQEMRYWMTRLETFDRMLEALAQAGHSAEDLKKAANREWIEMRGEMVEGDMLRRYSMAVHDSLLRHLSPIDAEEVYPRYLRLLKLWLESDDSNKPLVFSEYTGEIQVLTPSGEKTNAQGPYPIVQHFDVSGFFPMPTAQISGPGIVSTLIPSPAATRDTPRWVDGAKGYIADDQIFDSQGRPLLAPPVQAEIVDRIVTSGDGRIYALVRHRSDATIKNQDDIVDVLTGRALTLPQGAARVYELHGTKNGNLYAEIYGQDGSVRLFQILADESFTPLVVVGQNPIWESNGRLFVPGDVPGKISEIGNQSLFTSTLPSTLAAGVREANRNGDFGFTYVEIVAHPKSDDIYFLWNYRGRAALYDRNGQSLAPDDAIKITRPFFDKDGNGFYMALRAGSPSHWELRGIGSNYVVDYGEQRGGNESFEIVAKEGPLFIIHAPTGFRFYDSQTGERGSHGIGGDFRYTVIGGKIYYVIDKVLVEFSGSTSMSSWKQKVVSWPNATDVTLPFESKETGTPIFAEQVDQQWRWSLADNQNRLTTIKVAPRPERPHHFLVEALFQNSVLTYDWDGDGRLTPIGSFSSDQADFYETRSGLYRYLTTVDSLLSSWPDGRNVSQANPHTALEFRPGPDGQLYYWGFSGNQDTLWHLPGKTPIFSVGPDAFPNAIPKKIEDVQFSPDGKGYILVRDGQNQEMLLYRFDGTLAGKVKIPPVYLIPKLFFSPDGTPYMTLGMTPNLYNLSAGTIVTNQLIPDSRPLFAPDGTGYYRASTPDGNIALLKIPNEGLYSGGGNALAFSIDREGTPYMEYQQSGHPDSLERFGRNFGGVIFNRAIAPYFARNTNTGVTWSKSGSNSWTAWTIRPIGRGASDSLSEKVTLTSQYPAPVLPQPQSGSSNDAPVLFVPGQIGQYILAMDSYQEMGRLLEWAVRMQMSNPALAKTQAWQDFRRTLSTRAKPYGPFTPADRRILLTLLTEGQPNPHPWLQPLSGLDRLPAAQKEAREELARVILAVYQDYAKNHGGLPFNPSGVRTGVLMRRINTMLQASSPWRWGESADEKALVAFNGEISKLTNEHPWLRLNPADISAVWLSPGALILRDFRQAPHRLLFWLLIIEFLSAAASRLADTRLRRARASLYKVLNQAAASDLFQFDPKKRMIPMPADLIPTRSVWTHLGHSLVFLAFVDWVKAGRLAAASEAIAKRMLAEGKQPSDPIGDVGSLGQFMQDMKPMVERIATELKQKARPRLTETAA